MPAKVTRISVFLIAILEILTFSQCGEICDFSPPLLKRSNWELIELDNSGAEPQKVNNNSVSKEIFGLGIQYKSEIYRNVKSCPDKYYEFSNPVTEVFVYTLQDFDQTKPAGALINDYFTVHNRSKQTNLPYYKSIEASVLDAFSTYDNTGQGEVDLILVNPPENPGTYQFKVKLKLASSDSIILESRLITLY
jgi:hypothetical protein